MIVPSSVASRGYLDGGVPAGIAARGYLLVVVDSLEDADPIILDLFLTTDQKVIFEMALNDTTVQTPIETPGAIDFALDVDGATLPLSIITEMQRAFDVDTEPLSVGLTIINEQTVSTSLTDIGETVNVDLETDPIVLELT